MKIERLKFSREMTQEQLVALVEEKMDELFPLNEEEHIKKFSSKWNKDSYNSDVDNYGYFTAFYHTRTGLVTPRVISDLQEGARLLSVGTGDGNLEKLLVKGFNVPIGNIHVADLSIHPTLLREGFTAYEFDMTNNWPRIQPLFNFIIFPESLGVALYKLNKPSNVETRAVEQVAEDPEAQQTFDILRQAYGLLEKHGEIRVSRCGGIKNDEVERCVGIRFKNEFPESSTGYEKTELSPYVITKH
jgi:hypothetical protein